MERDNHHGSSLLQSKCTNIVVHGGTWRDGRVGIHYDFAIVLLLEQLKCIDYVVGILRANRVSLSGSVGYENRCGSSR